MYEANTLTYLKRLAYDAEVRVGYLDCGPNDMAGSIRIFTAIDPEVRAIISEDMIFFRRGDGSWGAARLRADLHEENRIALNTLPGDVLKLVAKE